MVKGIGKFKQYFAGYEDGYILIGGAACDRTMAAVGLSYRATKDLDIVLIAEAMTDDFIRQMWKFIKDGEYTSLEQTEENRKFYRFAKPKDPSFPYQIELFSRKPDLLQEIPAGMHVVPVPAGEELSSLSAILMDDAYYQLLRQNCRMGDDVHMATPELLICLKAKAFIDLKSRRDNGEAIDQKNIDKHIKDVVRVTLLLTDESRLLLPSSIDADMRLFLMEMERYAINYQAIADNAGVSSVDRAAVLGQLHHTFG